MIFFVAVGVQTATLQNSYGWQQPGFPQPLPDFPPIRIGRETVVNTTVSRPAFYGSALSHLISETNSKKYFFYG
jgi:hypothetical protein